MEQFIEDSRYANLMKFCEEFRDSVKAYIVHFDTQAEAKANLQNKFKLAFSTVKVDSKRGPGLNVDIKDIFAEAKAEHTIVAEGWSTLSSAVARTGSQMRKELEVIVQLFCATLTTQPSFHVLYNNVQQNDSSDNSESDVSTEEDKARDGDDDYVLENKFNVSASFKQYQAKCEEIAKQEGFYVDGNLHQIL